ncbi:hypothetical protein LXL04_035284 [Taraxacum kok-saghyz]
MLHGQREVLEQVVGYHRPFFSIIAHIVRFKDGDEGEGVGAEAADLFGGPTRKLPITENLENKATVLYIGRIPHGIYENEVEDHDYRLKEDEHLAMGQWLYRKV